jgi:hypothetical protein
LPPGAAANAALDMAQPSSSDVKIRGNIFMVKQSFKIAEVEVRGTSSQLI